MLFDKIKADMVEALKSHNEANLSILRLIVSEVKNFEIAHYPASSKGTLTDTDVTFVLRKMAKSHKESIEMFKKGGREDLVSKEETELTVLLSYLPPEISEEEIRKKAAETILLFGKENFGKVMGEVMRKLGEGADGGRVGKIVKEELEKEVAK